MEFDDLDCECTDIEVDVDAEINWSAEDKAAFATLCADPVVKQEIRKQEAKFRAWARGQDWARTHEAQVLVRAASQVSQVVGPASRTINPAHHTQVGGSDDGDGADSDSHVLAYHQHMKSIVIWTSALEVLAVILPAAKSIKQHTYQIGNLRLDLADYPADFIPDYSPDTLRIAAKCAGHELEYASLQASIQSGHRLHKLFSKFPPPAYPGGPAYPNGVEDFGWLARQRDPGRKWYYTIKRMVEGRARVWALDPVDGKDIVSDAISRAYHSTLKGYDASRGFSLCTYASNWINDAVSRAIPRAKGGLRPTKVDIRKSLALAIERLENFEAAHQPPAGIESSVFLSRRSYLTNEVEQWQKAKRRGFEIIGCESLSMNPSLSDADVDGQKDVMDLCTDQPDAAVEHSESSAILEVLLGALTARERRVVHLRHLSPDPSTWDDVAASIGVSYEVAKSAHQQAMTKLRNSAKNMGVSLADLL